MTTLSRLSCLNIDDDILRSYLFADVIEYSQDETNTDAILYEIKPNDQYRPDLASFMAYGTVDLRWVISVVADVEDEADPLPVGTVLRLPPAAWVRERIRYHQEEGDL